MIEPLPPHVLTQRGYWSCPVQVMTGLSWCCLGIGVIAALISGLA